MAIQYAKKRLEVLLKINFDELAWFSDSPDVGDPACVCSYCNQAIPEGELCLRFTNRDTNKEARLCQTCRRTVIVWVRER